MPEQEIAGNTWNFGPWVIGVFFAFLSAFGVAIRNEYTTKKINSTLYDSNNGLRLVKKEDCRDCQQTCQQAQKDSIKAEAMSRRMDRDEVREDLKAIHKKIDDLPLKMISILRANEPK
jgi:hypothetical protein